MLFRSIEGQTPLSVEIEACDQAEAYCPQKSEKGVLWGLKFKGSKSGKIFGVNVTNGNLIEHLHGRETAGWIGKRITLRIAECKGKMCIRIDAPGAKLPSTCPRFKYIDGDNAAKKA